MKLIKGDLLQLAEEGHFDAIVHGCNCFCVMGSGLAKQIKEKYPEAYAADLETPVGDRNKLGYFTFAEYNSPCFTNSLTVFNAYTQYTYGRGKDLFEYGAFQKVLIRFKAIDCCSGGLRWGFPLIGCGLAGGDKQRILKIMEDTLVDMDVTVVEFDK